MHRN
jgi:RNA-directed DNA polymerase